MVTEFSIRHVKRGEIDPLKWERCIASASNGSPYARVEYLDALSPHWEALIFGDYEWVMPLPVKKKYGIRYLYQPFLIPHLGVFGKAPQPTLVTAFLDSIPSSIKWIDITLNPRSIPTIEKYPITQRPNFILDLNRSYMEIQAGYRLNHIRNIQRAERAGCYVDRHVGPLQVFELAEKFLGPKGHFPAQHKEAFLLLVDEWIRSGSACAYGIRSKGQLLSAAVFLKYQHRAYYLLVGNHPNGKTLGTSHALIDAFIKDHASKEMILDFEGSDVPSLAFFYQGFGVQPETFGWIRINRLPKWIAWMKRIR